MFTRRILALTATLFTVLTFTGTAASAATAASSSHYSVSATGSSHAIPQSRWYCRPPRPC